MFRVQCLGIRTQALGFRPQGFIIENAENSILEVHSRQTEPA